MGMQKMPYPSNIALLWRLMITRVLVWFSCGAASAVAAKLAVKKYGLNSAYHLEICYCDTLKYEHPDNVRFIRDVEEWTGYKVARLKSKEYSDVQDVWEKRQYVVGVYGASCTKFMKTEVRKAYQRPGDIHIFGLTCDEGDRIDEFEENNPIETDWVLMDSGTSKFKCFELLANAGIALPAMYLLGYDNNNCIGCIKGGMGYWNKIRRDFPWRFKEVAEVTRKIGVRLLKVTKDGVTTRYFLDELKEDWGRPMKDEPKFDCGVLCEVPIKKEEIYDGREFRETMENKGD
jgi:hypothetical protein